MKLSLILARSLNNVIGNKNKLVWHSETDLKWFQDHTRNKVCIMGYNTFKSMEKYKIFFKERIVFVITSRADYINDNALYSDLSFISTQFIKNIEDCLLHIAKLYNNQKNLPYFDFSEIMVVGGQSIYNQFYPYCSKIYLTTIYQNVKGDSYFSKDLMKDWVANEMIPYRENNGLVGMFEIYDRIDNIKNFD